MGIDNCPRCGKLYAVNFREVCSDCMKEIDQEYVRCSEYLRKNRGATIQEVSEETGVKIKQITKFIREGRISLVDAPNMGYPCEMCGTPIREGNMCYNCRNKFLKETSRVLQEPKDDSVKSVSSQGIYKAKS